MKFFDVIRKANRNLTQSRLRTTLTIIAIVVGAFTFTLTSALGEGFKSYITDQTTLLKVPDTLLVSKGGGGGSVVTGGIGFKPTKYDPTSNQFGFKPLEADDLDAMRQIPNVVKVIPSMYVSPLYIAYGNNKYSATATGFVSTMQFGTDVGNLGATGASADALALGYAYLAPLGFTSSQDALGKQITLAFKDQLQQTKLYSFVIKSVLANSLWLGGQVFINYDTAKNISDWQSSGISDIQFNYTSANVLLKPELSEGQLQAVQNALLNKGLPSSRYQDVLQGAVASIQQIQNALSLFSLIAIFVAAFGIINTLYMAVNERTREVGLLKALGMRSGTVFSLFATEAALIGLWGSILGILLAVLLGLVANNIVGKLFQDTLPNYQPLAFPPVTFVPVVIGITLLAFLAGTFPAIKAMRQDPITALRYE